MREEQNGGLFLRDLEAFFVSGGGIPTGATQNVKDLLSSPEIENILENSDFICLLNQASGDRKILAERLNILLGENETLVSSYTRGKSAA